MAALIPKYGLVIPVWGYSQRNIKGTGSRNSDIIPEVLQKERSLCPLSEAVSGDVQDLLSH